MFPRQHVDRDSSPGFVVEKNMTRYALTALTLFIAHTSVWGERKTVRLSGDGPFSITKDDVAMVVEKIPDNAAIRAKINDPAGIVSVIQETAAGPNGVGTVAVWLRPRRPGVVLIKFITTSRLPNKPVKTRTVRVTVQ